MWFVHLCDTWQDKQQKPDIKISHQNFDKTNEVKNPHFPTPKYLGTPICWERDEAGRLIRSRILVVNFKRRPIPSDWCPSQTNQLHAE